MTLRYTLLLPLKFKSEKYVTGHADIEVSIAGCLEKHVICNSWTAACYRAARSVQSIDTLKGFYRIVGEEKITVARIKCAQKTIVCPSKQNVACNSWGRHVAIVTTVRLVNAGVRRRWV